jgi:hypothetical protein
VTLSGTGTLADARKDERGAEAAFREMIEVAERLVAKEPTRSQWRHALADAHGNLGQTIAPRDPKAGLVELGMEHDTLEAILARAPDDLDALGAEVDNYDNQRGVYTQLADRTRAIATARAALDVEAKVVARDTGNQAEQAKAAHLQKELDRLQGRVAQPAANHAH